MLESIDITQQFLSLVHGSVGTALIFRFGFSTGSSTSSFQGVICICLILLLV